MLAILGLKTFPTLLAIYAIWFFYWKGSPKAQNAQICTFRNTACHNFCFRVVFIYGYLFSCRAMICMRDLLSMLQKNCCAFGDRNTTTYDDDHICNKTHVVAAEQDVDVQLVRLHNTVQRTDSDLLQDLSAMSTTAEQIKRFRCCQPLRSASLQSFDTTERIFEKPSNLFACSVSMKHVCWCSASAFA